MFLQLDNAHILVTRTKEIGKIDGVECLLLQSPAPFLKRLLVLLDKARNVIRWINNVDRLE